MGVFKRLAQSFRREAPRKESPVASSSSGPRAGAPAPWLGTTAPALAVGAVYRCVRVLADSVAQLPMQCLVRRGQLMVDDTDSRLWYLLNVQPDPALSAVDFWRQVVTEMLLEGNAYVVPVYSFATMDVDRLVLCRRGTVSHDILNDTYTVNDPVSAISGTYTEGEVLHFKAFTVAHPKRGESVLGYARRTVGIASAGDSETGNRFRTGGTIRGLVHKALGAVTGYGDYADDQLQKLADQYNQKLNVEGENIVSSPGQTGFTQLSQSSVDMQFLESRKFTVLDICRFFGVHPSFVFADTAGNYKSAEMANVAFLSTTLNPILRGIETELLRKLASPKQARKVRYSFDRRGLHACDLDARARYQAATIAAGLYTVNEWRAEENRAPVAGGDEALVSANLRPITDPSTANPNPNNEQA